MAKTLIIHRRTINYQTALGFKTAKRLLTHVKLSVYAAVLLNGQKNQLYLNSLCSVMCFNLWFIGVIKSVLDGFPGFSSI